MIQNIKVAYYRSYRFSSGARSVYENDPQKIGGGKIFLKWLYCSMWHWVWLLQFNSTQFKFISEMFYKGNELKQKMYGCKNI